MCGVPASKPCGAGLNVLWNQSTLSIMSPPPWYGGVSAKTSSRPYKHADAGRPADFVAAERQEIAPDLLQVDGQVPGGLRGVDERATPERAGAGAEFGDGVDRAHRVRDVREGEELHRRAEQLVQLARVQHAAVAEHRDVGELRAGALGKQLPRHDVRVVLEFREQDFVAAP